MMRRGIMSRLQGIRNEAGIALVTVLFVGASLTAVSSLAAFTTIQELRSGSNDRRATGALAFAEAGVDRMIQMLRNGTNTFNLVNSAGCDGRDALRIPTGSIQGGTFDAELTVYDPDATTPADRLPPAACVGRPTNPHKERLSFQITATGLENGAKRVVRQVIVVEPIGLPIGLYGTNFDVNGSPDQTGISMISETAIYGREKLHFSGNDPYYFIKDFFPGGVSGRSGDDPMPAAAHAAGGLFLKNNGGAEFPPKPNCTANKNGGSQSLWDSDGSAGSGTLTTGCSGQTGYPLSNKFTSDDASRLIRKLSESDHQLLKEVAKQYGLYCSFPGSGGSGGTQCIRQNVSIGSSWAGAPAAILASGTNNFVTYFEFRSGDKLANNISWGDEVWDCNDDPDLNRSAVVIVKNGGLDMNGNTRLNGAVIVDGAFDYSGTPTIKGTIIASEFRIRGTANFMNTDCWVRNMPGPFLRVVPGQWSELDR